MTEREIIRDYCRFVGWKIRGRLTRCPESEIKVDPFTAETISNPDIHIYCDGAGNEYYYYVSGRWEGTVAIFDSAGIEVR